MLNPPIYIDGMLGMGDTIYQRAFVKQLPAGTFIKTAWPELYEDLSVKAVRSDTTLRTQRKNEFRSSAKFYPTPSPRQTKRIFYGPDDLRRGSIFDAMRRQFGVMPAALDLPSFGPAQFTHQKPIAVIRPATVRSEWRSDSRNPDPDYLLRASRILRKHFCVISVADLQDGEEWLVGEEPEPELAVQQATEFVFVSIPIFTDAGDILRSHHFRKNEHIWYFTDEGIRRWFTEQGFECVEHNNIECELGRKGVGTYAFRRT